MKQFKMTTEIYAAAGTDDCNRLYSVESVLLGVNSSRVYAYATNAEVAALAVYDGCGSSDPEPVHASCISDKVGSDVVVSEDLKCHAAAPPYYWGRQMVALHEKRFQVLRISAKNLLLLAKAITRKDGNEYCDVSILVPTEIVRDEPLVVVGDAGVGVIMPRTGWGYTPHVMESVYNETVSAANAAFGVDWSRQGDKQVCVESAK